MGKSGTGFSGKASSSIGKSSGMGGAGKGGVLGSGGKGGKLIGSSSGSSSFGSKSSTSYSGSSGKTDTSFGSSTKNTKLTNPSSKSAHLESSSGKSSFGTSGKTASFLGYSGKTESSLGSSGKSPTEKSSFLTPNAKSNSLLGASDKNKPSAFSGKISPDPSRDYPTFINPQNKSQTRIGIIWIPTRKRNKKKEMVYNPHNYDHHHEKAPSMYSYMSGDTHTYQVPHKKKEEETDLLVPERPKVTTVAVNTGITAASIDLPSENKGNPDEKQEFIKHDNDENKAAGGDTNDHAHGNDSDYLENKDNDAKSQDTKWDKDKQGDNVDSVYLRPPPPHKARSAASTNDEEDCGIKCLYYTLQCCDCVLM